MAGEYYNTQVERLKQLKHFYDDDFYGFYNGNETREVSIVLLLLANLQYKILIRSHNLKKTAMILKLEN